MSWKNEIIDTRQGAMDFLCRRLADIGVPSVVEERREPWETDIVSPIARTDGKVILKFTTAIGKSRQFPLDGNTSDYCVTDEFDVVQLRQRKLGAAMVKAAIAIASDGGARFMELYNVCGDGGWFWPYLGAVLPHEPTEIGLYARQILNGDMDMPLKESDRPVFQNVVKLACINPFMAWRFLSQSRDLSDLGFGARHHLFNRLCYRKSLFLILGEATTREITSSVVGAIPVFRPPQRGDALYDVACALQP